MIWLTETHNANGPLYDRFRDLWLSIGKERLQIRRARYNQTHSELLMEIWDEIRYHDSPAHLITELDFIPAPEISETFEQTFLRTRCFAFFPRYLTRARDMGITVHPEYSGAWIIGIAKDDIDAAGIDLPLEWLEASGKYNDAANLAHLHLPSDRVVHLPDPDWTRESFDVHYPGWGTHLFYGRALGLDPRIRPLKGCPYTVGDHVKRAEHLLDEAGV